MRVHVDGGGPVVLRPEDFVAAGGEGSVYARDGVAYKVYAGRAPDPRALDALKAARHPGLVLPDRLLTDDTGAPVGFTMPLLVGYHPLVRLFARSFRDRHGLGPERMTHLVRRLRALVAAVHGAGFVIADLSETNAVVPPSLDDIALIDAASWQTPERPASAVTETIRDRHAPMGHFDTGTDWFAVAVLAFQLWIGIHPYRGRHPTLRGLDERMAADASAMDPAVVLPPACWPLDVIPPPWRAWLEATLEQGHRGAPPTTDGTAVHWVPAAIGAAPGLRLQRLRALDGPILHRAEHGGRALEATPHTAYLDGRPLRSLAGIRAVAWSPAGQPIVAGPAGLVHARTGTPVPLALHLDDLVGSGGALYARSGDRLVQIELIDLRVADGRAGRVLAAPRVLASVLPHATQLFPGLAVQRALGATWVGVLAPGSARLVRVPELDGHHVVDAAHRSGVAVLATTRRGTHHRFLLRFGPTTHDLRVEDDVAVPTVDFAVTDGGVLVYRPGDRIEVLHAAPGHSAVRRVSDPPGGLLTALDGGVGLVRGPEVYRVSMR